MNIKEAAEMCDDWGVEPEELEQWAGVLLEGEYRHGKGEMVNTNGQRCCLGVLRHHVGGDGFVTEVGYRPSPDSFLEISKDWVGFGSVFIPGVIQDELAAINDDPGTFGFEKQADYIMQLAEELVKIQEFRSDSKKGDGNEEG